MSNSPDVRVSKWAYLAPLILGGILALSALSLFVLGWIGGSAKGERALLKVRSDCAQEWGERIQARGESIGLGSPELRTEWVRRLRRTEHAHLVRHVCTRPVQRQQLR